MERGDGSREGRIFSRYSVREDVRRELALAIDAAESEKGRLTLTLKGDKTVDLELTVLGRYSKTAPYNCPKSDAIITRAADFLVSSGNVDNDVLCRNDVAVSID